MVASSWTKTKHIYNGSTKSTALQKNVAAGDWSCIDVCGDITAERAADVLCLACMDGHKRRYSHSPRLQHGLSVARGNP